MMRKTSRRSLITNIFVIQLASIALLFPARSACAFQPPSTQLSQADNSNQAISANPKAYAAVAEAAVAALVKRDLAGFKKLLSPRMIERLGVAPMEASLKNQILPFFADFERPGKTINISQTQDIFGSPGFAVYKTYVAKGGREKPFIVYVVSEKNRLVVANLLVNKTYQDMNQGRSPK
jgi:hypothetical protein